MAAQYYVSTNERGAEHSAEGEIVWELPNQQGASDATSGARLFLRRPSSLLEVLDEVVFVAEPLGSVLEEDTDYLVVSSARLVRRTAWEPASAARFALDCAEHVLGDAGSVELPGGVTLAGAIADARRYLDSADDAVGARLGRLARFAAARRLRRAGGHIGDVALAMLEEDLSRDLDAAADPSWALATATADAVLSAVEALRHLAAPRYMAALEESAERSGEPAMTPSAWQTPWGPVMVGTEYESPYLSTGVLAREAALRARQAVAPGMLEFERAFQLERLAPLL